MGELRADIDRHEQLLLTLIRGVRELTAIQEQHGQAILELAAALREAGTDGRGVLPSPPAPEPASQNAGRRRFTATPEHELDIQSGP